MNIEEEQMPVIHHRTLIRATPELVYRTLTTADGWDGWFTCGTEVDPRPGGWIHFRWKDFGVDRMTLEDSGPVLEARPPKKFVFQWQPGSRRTTVTIELTPHDAGTVVDLRESGYAPTRDDLEALVSSASGWGEALTMLKLHLERSPSRVVPLRPV